MDLKERRISSKTIYEGKVLNLRVDTVELPNGKSANREVVEHSGAVAVVSLTEKKEILMVRQFRYPADKVLLEIPAGKIEAGEDPDICASRELVEETGYEAGDMRRLCSFYASPGFTDEIMYVYLARGLQYRGERPDEDEFLQIERIPLEKALKMVEDGEICDAKSIVGILSVKRFLDRMGD